MIMMTLQQHSSSIKIHRHSSSSSDEDADDDEDKDDASPPASSPHRGTLLGEVGTYRDTMVGGEPGGVNEGGAA
jgi:hypothetical protein